MPTLAADLDGYTDLPAGKIANVVTFLDRAAPEEPAPVDPRFAVSPVIRPDLGWYRSLYRRVGEEWLWFSRAVMRDDELAAILWSPDTRILKLDQGPGSIGLAELNFAGAEAEIATFGVVGEAAGTGAARALMSATLAAARERGATRVWLHTCTFDHPAAVPFYLGQGFRPFKFAIEISDDPRLTGHLRRDAARHVPVIDPGTSGRA